MLSALQAWTMEVKAVLKLQPVTLSVLGLSDFYRANEVQLQSCIGNAQLLLFSKRDESVCLAPWCSQSLLLSRHPKTLLYFGACLAGISKDAVPRLEAEIVVVANSQKA